MLATVYTYSKQSDGIFLTARPSHKSESESDGVKSGFRSDHDKSGEEMKRKKIDSVSIID